MYKTIVLVVFAVSITTVGSHIIKYPIRSDVIVTKWPEKSQSSQSEDHEPGWMRRQLLKFGTVASRLGNAMGAHATKITEAIDKVCDVIKTIIPFIAAVCHVGEFKFCAAATGAPGDLNSALNPTNLNLDELDK